MGLDQYLYRVVDPDKPVATDAEIWADVDGLYDMASKAFGPIVHGEGDDHPQSYAAFKRRLSDFTNVQEVHYWRKFNALHLWVERNCFGGGESNGDRIPISMEQLAGLQVTCERILANPAIAPDVLPTGGRFFFGSTEYDEWYLQDCKETAECIAALIAEEAARGGKPRDFFYDSSW